MARAVTTRELYDEIEAGTVPMILDVRNQDEYAAWQIEGSRPVEMRNLPIWMAVEQIEDLVHEIPENTVVVCAHGNGSDLLLDMFADEGKVVRNLEGGTAAWAELLVARRLPDLHDGIVAWQVQRPSKACISYVIGVPGKKAIVIDPARFPQFYLDLVASEGMTITHVIDTHVHADHITGGPLLAEAAGAVYSVPIEDTGKAPTPFANTPLADGEEIDLGDATVHVLNIKTPGHTPGSTCISLPGSFLVTGDTVFVRGVGRPDLTGRAEELASELFHTVHNVLQPLDPATTVLPAHWSFANEIDENGLVQTSLGHVFESALLNEEDMARFIQEVITSLPSAPETYDTIRLVNSGRKEATADEIEFLEIGKNQCAASTTT
ncbi:MAG: MBL fold metallo-hydrolase [Actinomycetales bacterium]|nr:MBL fold metallo-hydrolase [Actinomycetales bacterium]